MFYSRSCFILVIAFGVLSACTEHKDSDSNALVSPEIKASESSKKINDSTADTEIDKARQSLLELSATQIAPLLRSGEVTVSDYVDQLLAQADKHTDQLNAFITLPKEQVRDAAKRADAQRDSGAELGPLFGIPISLKDLIVTKDMATTFATDKFAGFISSKNAPIVDKLTAAGAIIFGKNNAQEWAFGSTGYNSHYGQQLNPYDESRIAGGSSGGSAAAVAARILPISLGTDTVASIRVPAAYTGLYGLRPTTGRYDNTGIAPLSPTLDTVGPMTRSVSDMALIDAVLSGQSAELPSIELEKLRLGVPKSFFHAGVSAEMLTSFNAVLDRLSAMGVTLVEADLPEAQTLTDAGVYPILFFETYPAVQTFLKEWGNGTTIDELHAALGSDVQGAWNDLVIPDAPNAIPKKVYKAAIEQVLPAMQGHYQAYFEQHDVSAIIFPATASEAPSATPSNPQETIIDGKTVSIYINDHNSSPGALAGQPGVVLPMGLSKSGLPMGVSLDGKRGEDRELLAIAAAIETIIPPLPLPRLN